MAAFLPFETATSAVIPPGHARPITIKRQGCGNIRSEKGKVAAAIHTRPNRDCHF